MYTAKTQTRVKYVICKIREGAYMKLEKSQCLETTKKIAIN